MMLFPPLLIIRPHAAVGGLVETRARVRLRPPKFLSKPKTMPNILLFFLIKTREKKNIHWKWLSFFLHSFCLHEMKDII